MAFLADFLTVNFPGSSYRITRFRVKFRKVNFPGDQLTCQGKIKKISDEGKLLVSVATVNTKGETTTDGDATVISLATPGS